MIASFCFGHPSLNGMHKEIFLPQKESCKQGSKISEVNAGDRHCCLVSILCTGFRQEFAWERTCSCPHGEQGIYPGGFRSLEPMSWGNLEPKASYSFLAVVEVAFYVLPIEVLYFLWPLWLSSTTSGLLKVYFLPSSPFLNLRGDLVVCSQFTYM